VAVPAYDRRDEQYEEPAGEPLGVAPAPPRFSTRRRIVAGGLLACFLLALAYPFYASTRVRYFFRAVPVIAGAHAGVKASAYFAPGVLDSAEAIVQHEVRRGGFPGGALAVGVRGQEAMEVGVGRIGWGRLASPVDADETMYDLASLTKVLGTTTAVMLLVDDGKIRLDDPVKKYLPAFSGHGRDSVTIRHLLTHTAGLPAGTKLVGPTPGDRLEHLIETVPVMWKPGTQVLYSDLGFIILGQVAVRAAGMSIPKFLQQRVWGPLGMAHTRYQPGKACDVCAPTLTLGDGSPFAGETNDPTSRELGGVTGNAGLFSTAHDVARYAAMIANGGELDGRRIISEATLREFTHAQPHAGTRGLGFEVFCQEGTVPDQHACKTPYAYGHTGYTGTSMWIDPHRGIWVVLLTNRTYLPKAPNRIRVIRRRLFNLVTGTVVAPAKVESDTAPERR
jgi:CubicO group peptidase (beta-lactamase class C family)